MVMPPGVGLFVVVFPAERLLPAERTLTVQFVLLKNIPEFAMRRLPKTASNPKLLPEETLFSTAKLTLAALLRKPEPPQRLASTLRIAKAQFATPSIPWLVMPSMATFSNAP